MEECEQALHALDDGGWILLLCIVPFPLVYEYASSIGRVAFEELFKTKSAKERQDSRFGMGNFGRDETWREFQMKKGIVETNRVQDDSSINCISRHRG